MVPEETSKVSCPECGSPMTRRQARHGPNAGGVFWGCSTYPKCKETIDDSASRDEYLQTGASVIPARFPPSSADDQDLQLKPRHDWRDRTSRGSWTSLYTIGGGHLRCTDVIAKVVATSPTLAARVTQTFIAVTPDVPTESDSQVVQVVGTFRKILQRGDSPPTDPAVERLLLKNAGVTTLEDSDDPGDLGFTVQSSLLRLDNDTIEAALSWGQGVYEMRADLRLDSAEERDFVDLVTRDLGPGIGRWLYPQAPVGPLIGERLDDGRIDFLLSVPGQTPIAIEIDGAQHQSALTVDQTRDATLAKAGVPVHRFTVDRLRQSDPAILNPIDRRLAHNGHTPDLATLQLVHGPAFITRWGLGLAEGIERGWLPPSSPWVIRVHDPLGVAEISTPALLELLAAVDELWAGFVAPSRCTLVLDDGRVAWERTGTATYSRSAPAEASPRNLEVWLQPHHSPNDEFPSSSGPTIVLRAPSLPISLSERRSEGRSMAVARDPGSIGGVLERVLRFVFAKQEFREGQEQALNQVLRGRDCLVLLPTGAGKSLIYQMAGLLLPGRTLIIDPIVALIEDQLASLRRFGIDRAVGISTYTTQLGLTDAALDLVRSGDALFCFVAPERLQQKAFRESLQSLTAVTPINVAVVDEAHCISEWGHNFRYSYLDLGPTLRAVCRTGSGEAPPILALTGTASRSVLRDVMIELDLDQSDPDAIVRPTSFDRAELSFEILTTDPGTSHARLVGLLNSMPGRLGLRRDQVFGGSDHAGIVFCPHVNGPYGVTDVAREVSSHVTSLVGSYSGRPPRGWDPRAWNQVKRDTAERFRSGDLAILCATSSFGMGVDLPNVRYTIHLGIPSSIEAYYQEAGRAGRDRRQAHSLLVFAEAAPQLNQELLADLTDNASARALYEDKGNLWDDDIQRQLYFFFGTFQGTDVDNDSVSKAVALLDWSGSAKTIFAPFGDPDGKGMERALLRLTQVGMVRSYLKDWGSKKFEVHLAEATSVDLDRAFLSFVTRHQPGRLVDRRAALSELARSTPGGHAKDLARLVVVMVYDVIEKSRRRAIREMRLLSVSERTDAGIRSRINDYFRHGELAPAFDERVDQPEVDLADWCSILELLTIAERGELRGTSARYLESYPDHPGLLVSRAFAELLGPGDPFEFSENLRQAWSSGTNRYQLAPAEILPSLSFLLRKAAVHRADWLVRIWIIWEEVLGDTDVSLDLEESDFLIGTAAEAVVLMSRRLRRHVPVLERLADHHREETAS